VLQIAKILVSLSELGSLFNRLWLGLVVMRCAQPFQVPRPRPLISLDPVLESRRSLIQQLINCLRVNYSRSLSHSQLLQQMSMRARWRNIYQVTGGVQGHW
jgi:hypothetical protein